MKAFLAAVLVALVVAIGASFALDGVQETAPQAYTTEGVRLENPGNNLVRF
ncbi:MAG: hypothetical protein Q4F71_01675 [Paracoccus sp. (in: a-proteobacteria)]|nr:hypothetical protein [Paracoccus sp. (in: a-proteobacteria)]